MKTRQRKMIKSALFQIFCITLGLFLILPIIYALLVSFMQSAEILTTELHILPDKLYLGNYIHAITKTKMFRFMLNSLIVALVSSVVRIIVASLAAYGFSFFEFKGKKVLFFFVVASMIIPADVLLVQNYFTVAELGLINTYLGMMITFFISAMNIFMLRQHFSSYSIALKEASMIDGCGNFKFFIMILLPSSIPILSTVFISSFVGTWNTYLWPLIVTNVNEMRTAQVAITMLNVADASSYGTVLAASILILIPSILIFVLFQRKIVAGMMEGAVK